MVEWKRAGKRAQTIDEAFVRIGDGIPDAEDQAA